MLGLHLVPEEPFVGFQPPRQDYAWLVPPWVFLQPREAHRAQGRGFRDSSQSSSPVAPPRRGQEGEGKQLSTAQWAEQASDLAVESSQLHKSPGCLPPWQGREGRGGRHGRGPGKALLAM